MNGVCKYLTYFHFTLNFFLFTTFQVVSCDVFIAEIYVMMLKKINFFLH